MISIITKNTGTLSSVEGELSNESRSNFTPLATKNTGMRNPNPIASSFGSSASSCSLFKAILAMMPAAKAPSRLSSPRVVASRTSPVRVRSRILTGSCEDVERCLRIRSITAGGWGLLAIAATAAAIAANAISNSSSLPGSDGPSRIVMAMTGPNSPIAPAAKM